MARELVEELAFFGAPEIHAPSQGPRSKKLAIGADRHGGDTTILDVVVVHCHCQEAGIHVGGVDAHCLVGQAR